MSRLLSNTAIAQQPARERRLVLLVGSESEGRNRLARALIERGHSTIICSGPPGCILLREDRCPLVDTADVSVIMPTHAAGRELASTLSLCARDARNPVIVEPSAIRQPPLAAKIVHSSEGNAVLEAVDEALERDRAPKHRKKGVADVADIWL